MVEQVSVFPLQEPPWVIELFFQLGLKFDSIGCKKFAILWIYLADRLELFFFWALRWCTKKRMKPERKYENSSAFKKDFGRILFEKTIEKRHSNVWNRSKFCGSDTLDLRISLYKFWWIHNKNPEELSQINCFLSSYIASPFVFQSH